MTRRQRAFADGSIPKPSLRLDAEQELEDLRRNFLAFVKACPDANRSLAGYARWAQANGVAARSDQMHRINLRRCGWRLIDLLDSLGIEPNTAVPRSPRKDRTDPELARQTAERFIDYCRQHNLSPTARRYEAWASGAELSAVTLMRACGYAAWADLVNHFANKEGTT